MNISSSVSKATKIVNPDFVPGTMDVGYKKMDQQGVNIYSTIF